MKEVFHSSDKFIELRKIGSAYEDTIQAGVRFKNQRSALFRAYNKNHKEEFEINTEADSFVLKGLDLQIENYEKDDSINYSDDYSSSEVEESLVVCSSFPHGYSLKMGRSLYYLGKHIVYNIPPTSPFTKVTLTIHENSEFLKIFDNFYNSYDETLTSAILDCLNYDTTWIETEIKKVDFCLETTNPLSEYDFIKKIYKDLIII